MSLTSETTRANPSSGRWNYGQGVAGSFAESGDFHVTFGFSEMNLWGGILDMSFVFVTR